MKTLYQVSLECTEGTSDKAYQIAVVELGNGEARLDTVYGPRMLVAQNRGNRGSKTYPSAELALRDAKQLNAAKLKKGYRLTSTGSQSDEAAMIDQKLKDEAAARKQSKLDKKMKSLLRGVTAAPDTWF